MKCARHSRRARALQSSVVAARHPQQPTMMGLDSGSFPIPAIEVVAPRVVADELPGVPVRRIVAVRITSRHSQRHRHRALLRRRWLPEAAHGCASGTCAICGGMSCILDPPSAETIDEEFVVRLESRRSSGELVFLVMLARRGTSKTFRTSTCGRSSSTRLRFAQTILRER